MNSKKKKVVYFTAGLGAGGVFRALALHKAFKRLASDQVDFLVLAISDYYQLLDHWQIPSATMPLAVSQNTDRAKLLAQFLGISQPDALIVSYHIHAGQGALDLLEHEPLARQMKRYLILRQFPHLSNYLSQTNFQPYRWSRIFGIEPEVTPQINSFVIGQEYFPGPGYLQEVAPTFAVWSDEVLPQEEARKQLLALAGKEDNGKPLMLICHNGAGEEEAHQVLKSATDTESYQTVFFSQSYASGATFNPEPIARLFQGVDHLVAAPGHCTFYEWLRYGRPEAKVSWLPVYRNQENSAARIPRIEEYRQWLSGRENGAEAIARQILEDLA